ncbi:MAG: efflux RND transporter permease subunit [Desulfovibrionaceae bacterium]
MSQGSHHPKFTDFFIERPVMAVVLALSLFLLGAYCVFKLPVRLYPKIDSKQIVINTEYPGASAEAVQGYVTRTISKAVGAVNHLAYVTSKSVQGKSTVTAVLKLGADADSALTEVMSKVDKIKYLLPPKVYAPQITKKTTGSFPLFYLGFSSRTVPTEAITDFLEREVLPRISALPGTSDVGVQGPGSYAMRVDLDPDKMAALGVSPQEVDQALLANDCIASPGQTKGTLVLSDIRLETGLSRPEEFRQLVVKKAGDGLIRLGDLAEVELGPQKDDVLMSINGDPGVFLTVTNAPGANPLSMANRLEKALEQDIKPLLPPGVKATKAYDATLFIRASVKEVIGTLGKTITIVLLVVILFLASIRSSLAPIAAVPLSIVGVFSLMLVMGFSLNILTMLAIVLAIGLVVDDAILITENATRHIENGKSPLEASIIGTREVSLAIIGMTVTLAAVFSPLAFMGGLTGSLFSEFALTLVGAVAASAVVALFITPVLASKVLSSSQKKSFVARGLDKAVGGLQWVYGKVLRDFLTYRVGGLLIGAVLLVCCYFLYAGTPQELSPSEDQSLFLVRGKGPAYANVDYLKLFSSRLDKIAADIPELSKYFVCNGYPSREAVFGIYSLAPWGQRTRSQKEIMQSVAPEIRDIAGLQCYTFGMPPLPGGYGLPVQVVLATSKDFPLLYAYQEKMVQKAMDSGMFSYLEGSLQFDTPVTDVRIDRLKAAELGVTMAEIGEAFGVFYNNDYVNRFTNKGLAYQVIPRVLRPHQAADRILEGQVKTVFGAMTPLSNFAEASSRAVPDALTQFDQLNSATISGSLSPGVTLGQGLDYLQGLAKTVLPKNFQLNYTGQSRQYIEQGDRLLLAFAVALVVIYLALTAQFNSFREPLIILLSVPGALCGALIPLYLGLATINIYTQVGLLTLTGLISKHSILLVTMANEAQRVEGKNRIEAAFQGGMVRLRPFLMTTAAMAAGVIPLLLADGAGAHSRFDIGLVLFSGMLFGSAVILIVVPVVYTFLAKDLRGEQSGG